jgi:tRNA-dihydrouridine synthase
MKKFYKVYVSGWPGAAALRAQLMEARDAETVREIVSEVRA